MSSASQLIVEAIVAVKEGGEVQRSVSLPDGTLVLVRRVKGGIMIDRPQNHLYNLSGQGGERRASEA